MTDSPFSQAALEALVAAQLRESPPSISAPAPPKPKGVSKWAQLATLGGHMADGLSTVHSISNGATEMNPIYGKHPSAARVMGTKGAAAALQMLIQHVLGKEHPKAANILGYTTGGALGGVALHNLNQANKGKK